MRIAGAIIALTLACGCLRFGYDARQAPSEPKHDAAVDDAGEMRGDAASVDAGGVPDGGVVEAGAADASVSDAGADASSSEDAGLDAATDAGEATDDAAAPGEDAAVDGGMSDASVGSPLCPDRMDALFCDAFEDPVLSSKAYRVLTNGTVTQSTARANSGTGSLHATTTSSSTRHPEARYGVNVFDNVTAGDLWLRAYYYIPSSVTVNRGFSTLVVAESEPPFFGFSLMVRATRVEIAVGNTMYPSSTAFPRDRWTCVELHVQIDAAEGYFEAYLDGVLAVQSPATDTLPAMGYSSADVGIHYAELNQGAVEVFVDDAAAGEMRIPCE